MNLIAFLSDMLIAVSSSVAAKVLLGLGFGFITSSGMVSVVSSLTSNVNGLINGLPADILQLLNLGGFVQGIGYLLAAFATRAAFASLPQLSKLPS